MGEEGYDTWLPPQTTRCSGCERRPRCLPALTPRPKRPAPPQPCAQQAEEGADEDLACDCLYIDLNHIVSLSAHAA